MQRAGGKAGTAVAVIPESDEEIADGELVEELPLTEEETFAELAHLGEQIRAGLRRTVDEHMEIGRALTRAKIAVYGDWEAWCRRETGLSERTCQVYMQIAASEGLQEAQRVAPELLTTNLRTLAVWARFSREKMQIAIAAEEISPDIPTAKARDAVNKVKDKTRRLESPEEEPEDGNGEEDENETAKEPVPRLCGGSLRHILDLLEEAHLSYARFTEVALQSEASLYDRQTEVAKLLHGHADWIEQAASIVEECEEDG